MDEFSNNILARYFCNNFNEATSSRTFDVVVIGSGMYGAYIANKLYDFSKKLLGNERRLKILILEAGPYLLYEHIENLPPKTNINLFKAVDKSPYKCTVRRLNNEPVFYGDKEQQGVEQVTTHSYCVGGKSLTWGKWSPRLVEKDLELWPQELATFLNDNYDKVEKETGVSEYDDFVKGSLFCKLWMLLKEKVALVDYLKLMKPPVAAAVDSLVSGSYSPDAYSSLGALLANIRFESAKYSDSEKSIFLVPNTLVYNLEVKEGRVSRINVVDVNTKETKSLDLSQCDVILAGTAVESTRLVLNSFPAPKREEQLIGRNLMAHLFSDVKIRIKRQALGFSMNQNLEPALYHIPGYSERFKRSYHFQLFCASISNADSDVFEETLYKMLYDFEESVDLLEMQDREWVTIVILSCSELKGKPDAPLGTIGSNWMDLSPDLPEEYGQVKYAKPFLNWESSQEDEDFWDEVLSNLFEFVSSLAPSDQIQYFDKNENGWTPNKPTQFDVYQPSRKFWDSRHESGTLWMGEKADESVTDLDGKFHQVANLYCADQAIFPTVGSANPVLTGLTLDRKIAQAIVDRRQDFSDNSDLSGFRSLFDRTTFDNWLIEPQGIYRILFNEILELEPKDGRGLAWYKSETFSEFELILDWKVLDYTANSGIFIHAPDPAEDPERVYPLSYEIQIEEKGFDPRQNIYGSPRNKTGAIYDLVPANRGNAKIPGFWNQFRIISSKRQIQVYLNGKLVSYLPSLLENKNTSGYICLQFHTNKVQFRNIRIKDL